MKKAIIAAVICMMLLCSCHKTPDNLNEQKPDYTLETTVSDGDIIADTDISADTLPEEIVPSNRGNLDIIRNQLDLDLKNTYKNLNITSARIGDGSIMPTYDIEIGMNPTYDFDSFLKYLYGDRFDLDNEKNYHHYRAGETWDTNLPAYSEPTYDSHTGKIMGMNNFPIDIEGFTPMPEYKSDPTLSSYTYSTGSVWGTEKGGGAGPDIKDWYNFETYSIYKRYDLQHEYPNNDESYTMADGKQWGVCDAIKWVEGVWKEYISTADYDDFTFSVKTLWVIDLGEDRFGYLFSLQKQDINGNYYDVDYYEYYFGNCDIIKNNEPFIFPNRLMTYCAEKEVLSRFSKAFSFNLDKQTDDGDNLLTLGAASDILSKALAKGVDLTLSAELNYVIICKGYPYFQTWEYPEFIDHVCVATCDFEIRPYWCFRPEQCYLIDDVSAERYFVDAVTGEVSTLVRYQYQKVTVK